MKVKKEFEIANEKKKKRPGGCRETLTTT